jgi:arylformamidase
MTSKRVVDLSLPLSSGMPHFEGTPPVHIAQSHDLENDGYRMCSVQFGNHAGTHLDAPSHFLTNGATVDQVALDRCIGEAVILDLSAKEALSPITVDDLVRAGATGHQRVLIRTDWDLRFGQPSYFTDFPPLAPEAAVWLADQGVRMLGLDTPSVHQERFVEIHEVLLSAGIAIVESLANLRSLPKQRVFFSALPIKLAGADGAPVRAVGLVYDSVGA